MLALSPPSLDFAALDAIAGGGFGVFDAACPLCGPERRAASNRVRPVLRVWREDEDFARYACARCGSQGYAHAERGANASKPHPIKSAMPTPQMSDAEKAERALRLWDQSLPPVGTPVMRYLTLRGVSLPPGATNNVIRWHPSCPFGSVRAGCMIALVRNIVTNEPQGVQRTALSNDGRKLAVGDNGRKSLGRISGGAIKLSDDADVETCLGIGEGVESTLSLRRHPDFVAVPVWSLLSKDGIAKLPVLAGLEGLVVAVDHDQPGIAASAAVTARYTAAQVAVTTVTARDEGADLNDLERAPHEA